VFFWEILDGWGGKLRLLLLMGVWGLSVGVWNVQDRLVVVV